jgi:GNAT superfamily N-acetyltransferase
MNDIRIELWIPDPARVDQDLEILGGMLHACVHAGASIGFILPFSLDDAKAFWRNQVLPGVNEGSRRMLVARIEDQIVGTVQIDLATPGNQPHRAEVKKMMVHPNARRRGIARALMEAIEEQARAAGRVLLTLDTTTGAAAEPLYLSMGYVAIGAIPNFALTVDSSKLEPTTVMYKELHV